MDRLRYLDPKKLELHNDEYLLEDDMLYLVTGLINLEDKSLRLGKNTVLRGLADGAIVSYNKKSVIRSGLGCGNVILREFSVIAPEAEVGIDIASKAYTNHVNIFFVGVFYSKMGIRIDGANVAAVNSCYLECEEIGLQVKGGLNKVFITSSVFYGNNEDSAISLGKDSNIRIVDISSSFFKFDAGYCIHAGEGFTLVEGRVRSNMIDGFAKPLKGLSSKDPLWWMSDNTGIKNSNVIIEMHTIEGDTKKFRFIDKEPIELSPLTISGEANERFINNGDCSFIYSSPLRPITLMLQTVVNFTGKIPVGSQYRIALMKNDEPVEAYSFIFDHDEPHVSMIGALDIHPFDRIHYTIQRIDRRANLSKAELKVKSMHILGKG